MASESEERTRISWRDFLESTPPGAIMLVTGIASRLAPNDNWRFSIPDLWLYCSEPSCRGERYFEGKGNTSATFGLELQSTFVSYRCKNCGRSPKDYALRVKRDNVADSGQVEVGGWALKIGEYPLFGPHTPSRLIRMMGPFRDLFLKGRRAETHGLGIGAFGYYRRVVEKQKDNILGEIAKAAKRIGNQRQLVEELEKAQRENSFSKAIESIRSGLPDTLMFNGHNPLTLLHSALSEGLHVETDEECLEWAKSVRVILVELSERVGEVLKQRADLDQAVSRLLNKTSSKAEGAQSTSNKADEPDEDT